MKSVSFLSFRRVSLPGMRILPSLYLLENLPLYKESELTLEEYYPKIISGLDVEYEIKRWERYWQDENK